jgi:hypothetical protein
MSGAALNLFDFDFRHDSGDSVPVPVPASPARPTIQEEFEAFHRDHPEVYAEFRRVSGVLYERYQAGHIKWISAKGVYERMRADFYFSSDAPSDREPFKFRNAFTSRYARLLIEDEPRFRGVMKTCELRTP